jgi:hypothetical protein
MLNLRKLIPARTRPKPAESIGPVFVSHSSKNKRLAAAVVAELESNGIRCWFAPRDIRPGDPNYGGAILDGLSSCKAMLLLLTEPSNSSQHVMKESERAVNRNLPILVVRFQPIEVSRDLEYYVSSAQFFDATEEPTQKHFPIIRSHVRDMLTRPTLKCVFTTTDAKGAAVECDFYPLAEYGLRVIPNWDGPVIALAPFFVASDFSYYIPEIKLTKSVVVTPDDVSRIKDFSVTLEEIPAEAR